MTKVGRFFAYIPFNAHQHIDTMCQGGEVEVKVVGITHNITQSAVVTGVLLVSRTSL